MRVEEISCEQIKQKLIIVHLKRHDKNHPSSDNVHVKRRLLSYKPNITYEFRTTTSDMCYKTHTRFLFLWRSEIDDSKSK